LQGAFWPHLISLGTPNGWATSCLYHFTLPWQEDQVAMWVSVYSVHHAWHRDLLDSHSELVCSCRRKCEWAVREAREKQNPAVCRWKKAAPPPPTSTSHYWYYYSQMYTTPCLMIDNLDVFIWVTLYQYLILISSSRKPLLSRIISTETTKAISGSLKLIMNDYNTITSFLYAY